MAQKTDEMNLKNGEAQENEINEAPVYSGEENAQEQKPARGRARMRMMSKSTFPDRNFDDEGDDAEADAWMDRYDEQDKKMKDYDERNKNMDDLFARNPNSAAFIFEMANGKDDNVASRARRFFGDEIATMMMDPDVDDEKLDAAFEERRKNLERIDQQEKEDKENWKKLMEHWQDDHDKIGLSVEQANESLDAMDAFIDRYVSGTMTDEDLLMFNKGINYDKDIATAKHDAEIDGRNAKIEEQMRRRKAEKNEVPSLGGQGRGGAKGQTINNSMKDRMGNIGPGIWKS